MVTFIINAWVNPPPPKNNNNKQTYNLHVPWWCDKIHAEGLRFQKCTDNNTVIDPGRIKVQ